MYPVLSHGLINHVILYVRKAMPSPVRLCTQRNTAGVFFRKRLQAGEINRIGKSSITYSQGAQGIKGGIYDIMPVYQCFTIDGLFRLTGQAQNSEQKKNKIGCMEVHCNNVKLKWPPHEFRGDHFTD